MDPYLELAIGKAIRWVDHDPSENPREELLIVQAKLFRHLSAMRLVRKFDLVELLDKDLCTLWANYRPVGCNRLVTRILETRQRSGETLIAREIEFLSNQRKIQEKYIQDLVQFLADEAEDAVRRIQELLEIFDLQLDEYNEYELRLLYQTISVYCELIPQFKYSYTLVFNTNMKEVPPAHKAGYVGEYLFPTCLRVRLRQMRKYMDRKKNLILLNTVFQGFKKGLMPIHPKMVDKSLLDHQSSLTSQTTIPEYIADRMDSLLSQMAKEMPKIDKFSWDFGISRKATYDYTYGYGGNVSFYRDLFLGNQDDIRCVRTPIFIGYVRKGNEVEEVFSPFLTRRELLEMDPGYREVEFISTPATILEPGKARIITKPFQGMHTGLQQLQKYLWKFLYNHKSGIFRLIGEKLDINHLWPILLEWSTGKYFNSGDFKAASDNLKQVVSERIYRKLFESLVSSNPRLYYRGLNSLCRSKIDYYRTVLPKYPIDYGWEILDEDKRIVNMHNGQLMGNLLSFPILCIANYLAYHISKEVDEGRQIKLWRTGNVLINGDDILFCTSGRHYGIWQTVTTDIGLIPSVGKNYFNDKFCQINSELWIPLTRETQPGVYSVYDCYKVPYVNFGMMTHRRKQDCSTDLSAISSQQMRTGIQNCLKSEGIVSDGWMQRLQNLVPIRRDLLIDLPERFKTVAARIFDRHCRPIFGALGLWKFYFDKMPTPYIDWLLRQIVRPSPSTVRELFPEFEEEKLNSDLFLQWDRLKSILKFRKLPYWFPYGSLEKASVSRSPYKYILESGGRSINCPDRDVRGY